MFSFFKYYFVKGLFNAVSFPYKIHTEKNIKV